MPVLKQTRGAIGKLVQDNVLTGMSSYLQSFLGDLQKAHDRSTTRPGWVNRMDEIARNYGLNPQKLVELANPAWAVVDRWWVRYDTGEKAYGYAYKTVEE
jgi:hypothetical protein